MNHPVCAKSGRSHPSMGGELGFAFLLCAG